MVTLRHYDPSHATKVTSHRRNPRLDGEVQQLAVCDRCYANDFKEYVNDYHRGVLGGREQQHAEEKF